MLLKNLYDNRSPHRKTKRCWKVAGHPEPHDIGYLPLFLPDGEAEGCNYLDPVEESHKHLFIQSDYKTAMSGRNYVMLTRTCDYPECNQVERKLVSYSNNDGWEPLKHG